MEQAASPQAKHWCFTVNNYTDETLLQLTAMQNQSEYYIVGKEVGENGTPHLQGYVAFKTKKRLALVKKILPTAHWEVKRGTVAEASDYCKKDGDFWSFGTLPEERGVAGGRQTKHKWDETKALAVAGKLDEIEPELYIKHYATFKRIRADHRKIPGDLDWDDKAPPNEWLYGETGTGKSRAARQENPGCYLKMNNKWWENYEDEEVVLIEDVGKSHEWMGDFLKIWADRYGFRAEVKHLSCVLRPKKIVVTSNYHPAEIWSDVNVVNPILRRFKIRKIVALPKNDENPPKVKFNAPRKSIQGPKNPLYRMDATGNLVPWIETQKKLDFKLPEPTIGWKKRKFTIPDAEEDSVETWQPPEIIDDDEDENFSEDEDLEVSEENHTD